ncbi:hypothetical protein LY10_01471 [Planktotalea frisia]|jgi:hypothetical protein|uniref:Phytanoyl-CoA dioxygenase (PhyH) n=1 Tax=Planktotalea frisia TaxID=696762 RepID=A0A1L9NZ11_9RHOB|nr:hypothetical protein [Planktotalea frisia]OJI94496.1 hypothetical protein PFRI_13170 [Planktotalea frisia]PZX31039.1 hypothetical protein LY10_01471 [Planktotalea frisia]
MFKIKAKVQRVVDRAIKKAVDKASADSNERLASQHDASQVAMEATAKNAAELAAKMVAARIGNKPATTGANADETYYPSSRARRPIGHVYDEFSRGTNPFSLIQTCGVADITDPIEKIVDLYNRYGIVKIRRLYSEEQSQKLAKLCEDFSGLTTRDFNKVVKGEKKWAKGGAPVLNDDRFWPFAANKGLMNVLHGILGEKCFEFGSAVAVHYSARGLHRDYRPLVEDPKSDYAFTNPKKRIVRVLHYCDAGGGAFGYIPFSHDQEKFAAATKRVGVKHDTAWFDEHRETVRQTRVTRDFFAADNIERHISWAYADPGDVMVTNSAMLHCGEYLTGPRAFFVSSYAEANSDTVKRAAAPIKSGLGVDYHKHMLKSGFKGSQDVLDFVKERDA